MPRNELVLEELQILLATRRKHYKCPSWKLLEPWHKQLLSFILVLGGSSLV
jgi:hypothetical protein